MHKEASVSSGPAMLDFLINMIKIRITRPAEEMEKTEKAEETKKKVEDHRQEGGMEASKKVEEKRRRELIDHLNHLYVVE